jgi:hypothetical protein
MSRNSAKPSVITDELVMRKIHTIRGLKVMLDRDLAELYGVPTKALKQAVRRNMERFPEDFMFEMNPEELQQWRSQIVTSNPGDKVGLRHAPFCFTEHGVLMLSSVLNSPAAIAVNIQVIRVFTKMREVLSTHKELVLQLEKLRGTVSHNSRDIKAIFNILKRMQEGAEPHPVGADTQEAPAHRVQEGKGVKVASWHEPAVLHPAFGYLGGKGALW